MSNYILWADTVDLHLNCELAAVWILFLGSLYNCVETNRLSNALVVGGSVSW